jgi:mannose-6-phosphate isomerase-like protein (cupin superfamily)
MTMEQEKQDTSTMRILRHKDAPGLVEAKCMTLEPYSPIQREGMTKVLDAGYLEGDEVKVLSQIPGFGLTHVWFKAGYPLPLHSHDCDCLYYIIAGSLKLGTEELGPRDSFFVPSGVPYTYKPGPDGVELLEFRHANTFNFVNLVKSEAFWEKAAESVTAHRESWKTDQPPRLNA